jgi:lipopolysaccharide/colanic/teichoic acid biosynthesis glycosyltransferase
MTRSENLEAEQVSVLARRILDLVVAGAGLAAFFPVMVLIAATILIDSGRPIFFSQIRLGQRGRHFRMYKFRKFYQQGRSRGNLLTMKNDCRMTPLGILLQRTKLDELPQLWNILKGEMSVVGPRPESLDFADCFVDAYVGVLAYKPGIFGPNQVFFRNEGSIYTNNSDPEGFYREILFPLKARVDLAYYPHRSILSDLKWILRGLFAVVGWSPTSEGIDQPCGGFVLRAKSNGGICGD